MTDRFPEFGACRDFVPDGTVIDGEVLAWDGDAPMPFNALQKRIGRKTVPQKLLAEAPAILMAYDLLEWQGEDIRQTPYAERRATLESRWSAASPTRCRSGFRRSIRVRRLAALAAERAPLARVAGRRGHAQAPRRALSRRTQARAIGGNGRLIR